MRLVFPVVLAGLAMAAKADGARRWDTLLSSSPVFTGRNTMKTDEGVWGDPLTVEDVEAKNTYPDDGRVPHVPFGFANANWQDFKAQMRPGDRIYAFSSVPESWKALAGRAGYLLVRDGKEVALIVTLMN